MNKPAASPETIDAYIDQFPAEVQEKLRQMRALIHEAAPQAEEKISYQLPTFYLNGNLVHFGAFKHHIGFYPAPAGIEAFKEELAVYQQSKGAVHFPLDQPIPAGLVRRIVQFRVEQNLAKKKRPAH